MSATLRAALEKYDAAVAVAERALTATQMDEYRLGFDVQVANAHQEVSKAVGGLVDAVRTALASPAGELEEVAQEPEAAIPPILDLMQALKDALANEEDRREYAHLKEKAESVGRQGGNARGGRDEEASYSGERRGTPQEWHSKKRPSARRERMSERTKVELASLGDVLRFIAAHGGLAEGEDISASAIAGGWGTATARCVDGASANILSTDNGPGCDTCGYGGGIEVEMWGELP